MRYFCLLSIFCCTILLMSNENRQSKYSQFDGFAFKSAGFDVLLDLPDTLYDYKGIEIPDHYITLEDSGLFDSPSTPIRALLPMSDVEIDNNTATLGRVIFYDQNMSFNRTVSCASCHKQANGFADDKAFSEGFDGILTHRNTLSITDLRTSLYRSLFWDDSSQDIREATILPLLNSEEMGMTMSEIIDRMEKTDYYPNLFNKAYGKNEITNDKIAEALSQFIVSISSYESKFDQSYDNYFKDLTYSEKRGISIFEELCADCHSGILPKFVIDNYLDFDLFLQFIIFNGPHNTGLDLTLEDLGLANTTGNTEDEGKFKTPGLKNVALTAPYMHDGRFETLEEVIDFYSEGLLPHPNSTFVNASRYEQTDNLEIPFAGFKFV